MKTNALIKKLLKQVVSDKEILKQINGLINQHAKDSNIYVNVLACEPADQPAKDHRYSIEGVGHGNVDDILESNNGPAIELKIHQNESLRSWHISDDYENSDPTTEEYWKVAKVFAQNDFHVRKAYAALCGLKPNGFGLLTPRELARAYKDYQGSRTRLFRRR